MKLTLLAVVFSALAFFGLSVGAASDTKKEALDQEVHAALAELYESAPAAKPLGTAAKAILIFPNVRRAGLVVGGSHGDGALLQKGKIVDYYTTSAISIGLEAGAQAYSFALLFMTDDALKDFQNRDAYEIGAGANVVLIDAGTAAAGGSATAPADVYGYVFGQKGLMAGISLQGTKISKASKPR